MLITICEFHRVPQHNDSFVVVAFEQQGPFGVMQLRHGMAIPNTAALTDGRIDRDAVRLAVHASANDPSAQVQFSDEVAL